MHHGSSDQFLSYLIEAPSVEGSVIWEKEVGNRVVRRRAKERSKEAILGGLYYGERRDGKDETRKRKRRMGAVRHAGGLLSWIFPKAERSECPRAASNGRGCGFVFGLHDPARMNLSPCITAVAYIATKVVDYGKFRHAGVMQLRCRASMLSFERQEAKTS
jgi:hypothetical protein